MNERRFKYFWNELRRRKVIRVAVVYVVVTWAAVEMASVVFPSLLLPDWSLRLLVVLALIGFPVAVGLAWAFEVRPESGGDSSPSPTATPINERAPPKDEERLEGWKRIALHLKRDVRTVRRWEKGQHLPVRRLMHDKQATVYAYRSELDDWLAIRDTGPKPVNQAGSAAGRPRASRIMLASFVLLVLAAVSWTVLKSQSDHIIQLGEWDWVLISDFENRTGEDVLEGTVEHALYRELTNSRFVKVAPRERLEAALALMKQPPDTRINLSVGREISLRDGGIRVLLTGRVDKLGNRYLLSTSLVNPVDGVSLASFSSEAENQEAILGKVSELAREVRQALGEQLSVIDEDEDALLKATTPSLEALRLFSEADQMMRTSERAKAVPLLEQALRLDPDFASANLLLVYLYREQGEESRARSALEQAVELADQTTERERLFILATYYRYLDDPQREIETYELLTRLYPDHDWANGNLASLLAWQGRFEEAARIHMRIADQKPNDLISQYNGARTAGMMGDAARAGQYLERVERLGPFPWLQAQLAVLPAATSWVQGDISSTLELIEAIIEGSDPEILIKQGILFAQVRSLLLALGQMERQRELSGWREGVGWFDAVSDWERGRKETMEAYLDQGFTSYWDATLLAVAGRTEDARIMLKHPDIKQSVFKDSMVQDWVNLVEGQIALAEGRFDDAISKLRNDYYLYIFPGTVHAQQLQLHSLAEAYLATDQMGKAIETLERSHGQKPGVITTPGAAWFWIRNLHFLHELYQQMGQHSAANDIREELASLLIAADEGHPFLPDESRS